MQVNLQPLLVARLTAGHISVAGVCTNDHSDLFCSYRHEKGKTGRMGVCICRNM
ncbi:MAG: laccase domain-containing protein [Acidaminococcaceae bacterium]|nr:laccase domain-containing protein [Acidaminococcaceae bacterium]